MKAKPVKLVTDQADQSRRYFEQCEVNEATHVKILIDLEFGPLRERTIPVIIKGSRDNADRYVWTWNGDVEKPTLKPSILTSFTYGPDLVKHSCHSWVNDGTIQFLSDCSHEKRGTTEKLLEWE